MRVVFGSGAALTGAWFAPAGSPAKKARREMGPVSSAGGGWRGLAGGLCTVDRGWHRALVFGGNRRAYRFAKSCPNFQGVQGLKWGAVVSLGWFWWGRAF
ncbi:hypothetical protein QE606_22335 [Escherichia coli]|nr:hypothetical protein [Escherichia coli]